MHLLTKLTIGVLVSFGLATSAFAQGIDILAAPKQQPNYVSDDMLLKDRKSVV